MKKALIKMGVVSICFLFTDPNYAGNSQVTQTKKHSLTHPQLINLKGSAMMTRHVNHMLALENEGNLKIYHYGIKSLNSNYHIPGVDDLIHKVRSHPLFIGKLPSELTKDQAFNFLKDRNASFLLFETVSCNESHFYVIHSKGMRHFTINSCKTKENLARLDNGGLPCYPRLNQFLNCTLA